MPPQIRETDSKTLNRDALWNLAMAINVYMTLFRKYNATQLKALEWRYHLMVRTEQVLTFSSGPKYD